MREKKGEAMGKQDETIAEGIIETLNERRDYAEREAPDYQTGEGDRVGFASKRHSATISLDRRSLRKWFYGQLIEAYPFNRDDEELLRAGCDALAEKSGEPVSVHEILAIRERNEDLAREAVRFLELSLPKLFDDFVDEFITKIKAEALTQVQDLERAEAGVWLRYKGRKRLAGAPDKRMYFFFEILRIMRAKGIDSPSAIRESIESKPRLGRMSAKERAKEEDAARKLYDGGQADFKAAVERFRELQRKPRRAPRRA